MRLVHEADDGMVAGSCLCALYGRVWACVFAPRSGPGRRERTGARNSNRGERGHRGIVSAREKRATGVSRTPCVWRAERRWRTARRGGSVALVRGRVTRRESRARVPCVRHGHSQHARRHPRQAQSATCGPVVTQHTGHSTHTHESRPHTGAWLRRGDRGVPWRVRVRAASRHPHTRSRHRFPAHALLLLHLTSVVCECVYRHTLLLNRCEYRAG